jgi:hypothetical protein
VPRSNFDVAVANIMVHHVDDLDGFFTGLMGLIKPGGWAVITEFGVKEKDKGKNDEFTTGKVSFLFSVPDYSPYSTPLLQVGHRLCRNYGSKRNQNRNGPKLTFPERRKWLCQLGWPFPPGPYYLFHHGPSDEIRIPTSPRGV